MPGSDVLGDGPAEEGGAEEGSAGDAMEEGWLAKSQGSSFKRTLEVWGFLAQCGLKIVKVRLTAHGLGLGIIRARAVRVRCKGWAEGDEPEPEPEPEPDPEPEPEH